MSFLKSSTRRVAAVLLLAFMFTFSMVSFANDDSGVRKIKNKVTPAYPEAAKRMNVSGSVKLEVEVSPTGSVKNVKALGGHPLLIQAAVDAVKQWKYEAGSDTTVQVEIKFQGTGQ